MLNNSALIVMNYQQQQQQQEEGSQGKEQDSAIAKSTMSTGPEPKISSSSSFNSLSTSAGFIKQKECPDIQ